MNKILKKANINYAASLINNGEIIAVPTETVYGLCADAYNFDACNKIFTLKGRPNNNPLIVHCADITQAQSICKFDALSLFIASQLSPGPISFVLPLKTNNYIAKNVTSNLNTLCIRIPSHSIIKELIQKAGVPIAAPSVNISNMVSGTKYQHICSDFNNIHVIAENEGVFGIESTIIKCESNIINILRPGFITNEILRQILDNTIYKNTAIKIFKEKIILSPGNLDKHYSIKTPLIINCTQNDIIKYEETISLNYGNSNLKGYISMNLSQNANLIEAATNLYSMMREVDELAYHHSHIKQVVIAPIPNHSIGLAINNRLKRAATK